MNYDELMQDFEISLIETLNEKEKELSNLCEENKEQFERFLIMLKFYDNALDISSYEANGNGTDAIEKFIYNLSNLGVEQKGFLFLHYLELVNEYLESSSAFLRCSNILYIMKILFAGAEHFEDSRNKSHQTYLIFKLFSIDAKNIINVDIQSLLNNELNGNCLELDSIKDMFIYAMFIRSIAIYTNISHQSVAEEIEEMKTYPEIKLLVEEYQRKLVELELQQKHEQEARTI